VPWTLLSNHGLTLICLARNPEMTLREIGDWVGVTERTAHEITKELCADGYLSRDKVSGRSRYTVHAEMPLRHPGMDEHNVGEMLSLLVGGRWTPAEGHKGEVKNSDKRTGRASGSSRKKAN